ncbi:MAG: nucleoid-associated protein [Anaerolineales bacterium]|jgi:hypothetical protein
MPGTIEIQRLAVHYLDKAQSKLELAPQEQPIAELSPFVRKFLTNLVLEVWQAEDSGNTTSAKFAHEAAAAQFMLPRLHALSGRAAPSLAEANQAETNLAEANQAEVNQVGANLAEANQAEASLSGDQPQESFFKTSLEIARQLYDKSPTNSSPGLLGVFLCQGPANDETSLALLKIEAQDEKLIRLKKDLLTEITVQDVENLLLEKIQKGAIYPHPQKTGFDLKVVDQQGSYGEQAKFFSKEFLGCEWKKSDEHQIKRLLPEVRTYAEKRDLPCATEKLPTLIQALVASQADITTAALAGQVATLQLYGDQFDSDDFQNYIKADSKVGDLHIPRAEFANRQGTRRLPREVTIAFTDPQYAGLQLSGPTALIEAIKSADGGAVTFTITTTRNGFTVKYG